MIHAAGETGSYISKSEKCQCLVHENLNHFTLYYCDSLYWLRLSLFVSPLFSIAPLMFFVVVHLVVFFISNISFVHIDYELNEFFSLFFPLCP